MTHINLKVIRIGTLAAVIASSVPLHAADPIEVPWNKVCQTAAGRELVVTTANRETVEGYCVLIDVNEIAITTKNNKVIKVARNTLTRIEMQRSKGHHLRSLRGGMRRSLRWGFESLLSPLAPVGIAVLPATLAWGAVAAPFCLLGDLKAKVMSTQEIKPI